MVANPDFEHLGRVVASRRRGRGWTLGQVAAQHGPSDTLLGQIEAGTWRAKTPQNTLRKLDVGLEWREGTAARVLYEGFDPTVGASAQDASQFVESNQGERVASGISNEELLREILRSRADSDQIRAELAALSKRMDRFESGS